MIIKICNHVIIFIIGWMIEHYDGHFGYWKIYSLVINIWITHLLFLFLFFFAVFLLSLLLWLKDGFGVDLNGLLLWDSGSCTGSLGGSCKCVMVAAVLSSMSSVPTESVKIKCICTILFSFSFFHVSRLRYIFLFLIFFSFPICVILGRFIVFGRHWRRVNQSHRHLELLFKTIISIDTDILSGYG